MAASKQRYVCFLCSWLRMWCNVTSWLSFCLDLPKIMNCNLELRAKPALSSNVWGWGSGYVIAIEIKLQKQLTFCYCGLHSKPPSHVYVCLCTHREQSFKLPTCLSLSFSQVVGMHHHAHSLIERIFKVVGQRQCLWVLRIRKGESEDNIFS